MAVSSLVLEDGGTETEAIAGLLHGAIEDCGAQVEPILRQRFGDAVVDIVVECSDAAPVAGERSRRGRFASRRTSTTSARLPATRQSGSARPTSCTTHAPR